jgi:hypothetical protein
VFVNTSPAGLGLSPWESIGSGVDTGSFGMIMWHPFNSLGLRDCIMSMTEEMKKKEPVIKGESVWKRRRT